MSRKDSFDAGFGSDATQDPQRIVFITRKTSAKVTGAVGRQLMSYPHVVLRGLIAFQLLTIILVILSLIWNAPLEQLANPLLTPNPAKAPWYFLGLQELLHYFPPLVAGVLIPALVVLALIVIPYFHINIADEPMWERNRPQRLRTLAIVTVLFAIFLIYFAVYAALVPSLLVSALMWFSAGTSASPGRFRAWLSVKPLSFWIMSWFLIE